MIPVKRYKRWVLGVLGALAFFIALNGFVWTAFTRDLLTDNVRSGDYTRVGYITGSSYDAKPVPFLSRKHIESADYRGGKVDVLTIGDSFSNGLGRHGPYYQDWIASRHDFTVLNIQKLPGKHFFETLVILANSGYLDRVRPKAVILEIVEQHASEFLSQPVDMDESMPLPEIEKEIGNIRYVNAYPPVSFINTGNLKFLLYSLLYRIRDNAFFSRIYVRRLNRPFFSVRNVDRLVFAYENFEHLSRENGETIRRMNDHLNLLAEKLRAMGITLYFMPIADKYDLYSPYLVKNPYPRSSFFETLRALDRKYVLIDTKAILGKALERGEKDIYYADDSHWSSRAIERIVDEVEF